MLVATVAEQEATRRAKVIRLLTQDVQQQQIDITLQENKDIAHLFLENTPVWEV